MEKVVAVVTGPEHNGTTYLKNLFDSHPYIFSAFETGILHHNDFSKCNPWNKWIHLGNFKWGLPKDKIIDNLELSIAEKYDILFKNKGSYDGKIQKLIKESKYIVDKTPIYIRNLSNVYERIKCYNIPIFITIKYFKGYYSSLKRRGCKDEQIVNLVEKTLENLIWLKNNKIKIKNIYLFRYQDILKPNFINKLKEIIKDRIDVGFEISYDKYIEKIGENTQRPYFGWKKSKELNVPNNMKELEKKYDKIINELKEDII